MNWNINQEEKIQKSTILIVDDNIQNINLATNFLQQEGYNIAIANSGPECFDVLSEILPDLILLDIMMPDMSGFEVCKKLKGSEITRHIPVIFLSAKSEMEDVVEGFILGGVDYVTKPFRPEELLIRIKTHIDLKKSKDVIIKQNKKLIDLNEHLIRLNEEKNALMSITAHDLKNPISGIKGYLDLLEDYEVNFDSTQRIQLIRSAKDAASTAFQIISDLLDINAVEQGRASIIMSIFNVNEIINDVIYSFNHRASLKKLTLQFISDKKEYYINADIGRFRRVIENLLSNAIKFSPYNKNIWIKVINIVDEMSNIPKVRIIVKDEGPGFKHEDMDKLFRKFTKLSAKPTAQESSSGLGLSIVKMFVDMMDGKVHCESEYGLGASLIIEFPIYNTGV